MPAKLLYTKTQKNESIFCGLCLVISYTRIVWHYAYLGGDIISGK